jgi:hypothetical protein
MLALAWAWPALGQVAANTPGVVAVPEVEVRSGASPKFYATSKLRQGDRVQVIREEGDWLAIAPPPGSFSWINNRFIERMGNIAVVRGEKVPILVGSSLTNQKPTVQQTTLLRGTQVVILGEPLVDDEGKWWPIQPHASEVRYVPRESIKSAGVETVLANRPSDVPPPPPPPGTPPPAAAASGDPLWQQAQQLELAGNIPEAIRLYEQLARQTSDHNLSLSASNRAQFLRDGKRGSVPAGYQPRPSEATYGRLVPTPAGTQTSYQPNYQRAASHYCYVKENSAPLAGAAGGAAPPPTPAVPQRAGPGRLYKAGFIVDGKQAYVLEVTGRPRLYVTGAAGVNLEPYVNRIVDLYGPIVYRGDLRTNYMTASQVNFLQ